MEVSCFLCGDSAPVVLSARADLICSNITHYSYFGAFRSDVSNRGPNAAMLTEEGKLTDIGSWYLGGAATKNIPHKGSAAQVSRPWFGGLIVATASLFVVL